MVLQMEYRFMFACVMSHLYKTRTQKSLQWQTNEIDLMIQPVYAHHLYLIFI